MLKTCITDLSKLPHAPDHEVSVLDLRSNASDGWGQRPTTASTEIPRRLHQTWKGCASPERQRKWQETCRGHNPAWELLHWTDEGNRQLVARDFPDFLKTFDGYDAVIKRVDAIRYMLMYRFGGVYMDLDFACLRPFDQLPLLLPPGRAVLGVGMPPDVLSITSRFGRTANQHQWSNAFIAAPPRHPFFASWLPPSSAPLKATGPRMLSAAVRQWQRMNGDVSADGSGSGLSLQPFGTIYNHDGLQRSGTSHPCGNGTASELPACAERFPRSFATTFWTATWIRP